MSVNKGIVYVKCEVLEPGVLVKRELDIEPTALQPPESVYVLRPPKLEPDTGPPCGQFSSVSFEGAKLQDSLVTFKDVLVKEEVLDCDPLDEVDGAGLEVGGQMKIELDIGPVVLQRSDLENELLPPKLEPETKPLHTNFLNDLEFNIELSDVYTCGKTFNCNSMVKCEYMYELSHEFAEIPSVKSKVYDVSKISNNFTCNCCPEKFNSDAELSIHLVSNHHTNKPFSCDHCSSRFKTKRSLILHMRLHMKKRLIPNTSKSSYDHLKVHTGVKPYSCKYCSKTFKFKSQYNVHSITHTDARPYSCEHCPKTFKLSSVWSQHSRTHTSVKPFSCKFCPSKFMRRCHLIRHLTVHTDDRPYQCEHCPKRFKCTSDRSKHARIHKNEKPFTCKICLRTFMRMSNLKDHLHVHSDVRPFTCDQCPKTFKYKSACKVHSRTHTGEKPFSCDICSNNFLRLGNLKAHLHVHTDEKPYSCEHCPKTFKYKATCKQHSRTHTSKNLSTHPNLQQPSKYIEKPV